MSNWYTKFKEAAFPALMPPRRFPNAEREKERLFNYIKSKNLSVYLFHATSAAAYDQIKQSGFIISPSAAGKGRSKANGASGNNVYFAAQRDFAKDMLGYILYGSDDPKTSQGVILKVKVPLWSIEELMHALFAKGKTGGDQETGEAAITLIMDGQFELAKAFAKGGGAVTNADMCRLLPSGICKRKKPFGFEVDRNAYEQLIKSRTDDQKIQQILNHIRWEKTQGHAIPIPGEYTVHDVLPAKFIESVDFVKPSEFEYDAQTALVNWSNLHPDMRKRPGVLDKVINDLIYDIKTNPRIEFDSDGSPMWDNGMEYQIPKEFKDNPRVMTALEMRRNNKVGPNAIRPASPGVDSLSDGVEPVGQPKKKAVDKQLALF